MKRFGALDAQSGVLEGACTQTDKVGQRIPTIDHATHFQLQLWTRVTFELMDTPRNDADVFREVHDAHGATLLRINRRNFRKIEESLRGGEVHGVISGETLPGEAPLLESFTLVNRAQAGGEGRAEEAAPQSIAEALEQIPDAIGYFRSVRRVNAEVSPEDHNALELAFGDRGGILMLIQTAMLGVSVLHVYQRGAGGDLLFLCRFPLYLESAAPGAGAQAPPLTEPPQRTPPSGPILPGTPSARLPDRAGVGTHLRRGSRAAIPIAASVLGSLLVFSLFRVWHKSESAAPKSGTSPAKGTNTTVALSIRETGDRVELRWDPNITEVRDSTHGSLTIFDDNRATHVELDAEQVQAGKYSYKPVLPDVIFQVVFFKPDNTLAVGTTTAASLFVDREPSASPNKARAGRAPGGTRTEAQPAARSAMPPLPYRGTASVGAPSANPPAVSAPAPRTAASIREASAQPPAAATPQPSSRPETAPTQPASSSSIQRPTTENRPTTSGAVVPPPAAETLAAETTPAPPAQPPQPTYSVPSREMIRENAKTAAFTGPVPVRRIRPTLPANVLALVHDQMTVKVIVIVDARGRVTQATLVPEKGIPSAVGVYALQAAKLWQFQPARRDGLAVEGQSVVEFRFEKR